jgi:hypothetical protein
MYQYLRFYKYSIDEECENIDLLKKLNSEAPAFLNYLVSLLKWPKRSYDYWIFNRHWEKKNGFRYTNKIFALPKYSRFIEFKNECLNYENKNISLS